VVAECLGASLRVVETAIGVLCRFVSRKVHKVEVFRAWLIICD
jgi:hypothetical protein